MSVCLFSQKKKPLQKNLDIWFKYGTASVSELCDVFFKPTCKSPLICKQMSYPYNSKETIS